MFGGLMAWDNLVAGLERRAGQTGEAAYERLQCKLESLAMKPKVKYLKEEPEEPLEFTYYDDIHNNPPTEIRELRVVMVQAVEEVEEEVDEDYNEEVDVAPVSKSGKPNYTVEEDRLIINIYNKYIFVRDARGELCFKDSGKVVERENKMKILFHHFKEDGRFDREQGALKQQLYKLKKRQKNGDLKYFQDNEVPLLSYIN